MGARFLLAFMWLLHWLPLGVQALVGRAFGALLYRLARSRRRIALRNLELCLPGLAPEARRAIAREHFGWLGRSLLERGLLWYAPEARLKRLIHVEGDMAASEQSVRPVMYLCPHFVGLDVAGAALLLHQKRRGVSIYQEQSNPVMDEALRRGRTRFGNVAIYTRDNAARHLVREIRRGASFLNLPDMDFGARDAAFVPFFGIPTATLLAPSRLARALDMVVQPLLAEMLPGGRGYRVRLLEPWTNFPTDDPVADAATLNRWVETQILALPAQYLWVHKRFKTRPPGEPSLYERDNRP